MIQKINPKKESFQQSYLDDNADDDGNAFDKTVYNVVDDWASMASFLDTKSGDCEDFSHLFYHALNRVYDRIDNRSVPSARLSSGMVRGEFSSVGHSVVEVMVDDNWRVIDCTNGPQGFVNGFSDFLTRSEYRQATCYDAYIEYQYGETKRFKDDQTLASFSTASLFKSPNANGLKDAKFKHYDDLRDRVYKLEQKKQTSQGIRSMNSISLTELEYMLEGSSLESVAQQIWELLQSLRLVSDTGQVNSDTVHSDRYMARFRSDMNGLIDPDDSTADLVADIELLLVNRAHVFSRQNNDNESASGLRETLQSFDALSEDLLSELTKSTTPNYVDSSSFVSCPKDSLFIRVDHERMQSMLSQFFQLQHTISAFMTVAFSISDTVSSIAAKLGDDSSLASSTAQQRQKIIKSFNSFSSGVNESVNTLMDLFLETVTTTNKARYQTAVSQIKLEFSDFSSQLTDEFFSKESKIQEEELMMKLSKDYYKMLYDNRLSMQKATLDVPDFGPSILPTRFANMLQGTEFSSEDVFDYLLTQGFIDEHGTVTELGARVSVDLINDDQFYVIREDIVRILQSNTAIGIDDINRDVSQFSSYGSLSSFQLWSALFANGYIDDDGLLVSPDTLSDISFSMSATVDHFSGSNQPSSDDPNDRMHALVQETYGDFSVSWSQLSDTQKNHVILQLQDTLQAHQANLDGFHLMDVDFFNTSRFLYSVMDMEARKDDHMSLDFDTLTKGIKLDQHNQYNQTLHLSNQFSKPNEPGSGFQIVDADLIAQARKSFDLMNQVRRIYLTMASAYSQFIEKIASRLSKDSTKSSAYGDWQLTLTESHMGLAQKRLSSIQSQTNDMITRLNELHKHRLNLIKLKDRLMRTFDVIETWGQITGAALMLVPTPMTQMFGVAMIGASVVSGICESWREYTLEKN